MQVDTGTNDGDEKSIVTNNSICPPRSSLIVRFHNLLSLFDP